MKKIPSELYGIPINEIARLCKVDLTTARRWKRGAICPPQTALMILAGDLGSFDPEWRGWIVRGGELISPEGWSITVNDVLASPLLRAQLATYQSELRKIQAERDALDEQPVAWDEEAIKRFIA